MAEPLVEDRPPAPWSRRVGAWLIDVVLVAAVVVVLGDLLGVGPGLATAGNPVTIRDGGLLLFVYWTIFEASTGQSPGKLALEIQVVGEGGHPPSLVSSAIQSFGKAFVLPLDIVVGLLAMRGERRRLFNRLSGTRVVSLQGSTPRQRGPAPVDA
jgi:uncharacterized RDD family membrane protein YckC